MGSVSFGTVPKWVHLGLAFTRDPLEPFQMELLAVSKWVHSRSRSQFPERSRVNGWKGSKRERRKSFHLYLKNKEMPTSLF